jgi:hypothetical protein|tara:strand:- start:5963 stop:6205 length:243 start_codon:yes stop_codon:yes gene_type:complete
MANKTTGNYNYGAAYIMGSDKVTIDNPEGSQQLYREGMEFTTEVNPDALQVDMPKKQTKPTVEASLFNMADDRNYTGGFN